ncbi:MAG: rRNA maturation RNase YbeY [Actinomycetota bacterium]
MNESPLGSGEQDPGGDPFPGITVDDEQPVAVDVAFLRLVAARACAALSVPQEATLAVTLVDPERMAELKEKALGERAPTDVLAFPMDDPEHPMPGPFVVGDVVICPEVSVEQPRAAGHPLSDELAMLLVHAILHCLGRDHATPAEEKAMFSEQAELLQVVTGERIV